MADGLGVLAKAAARKDPQDSTYPKTDYASNALGSGHGIPFTSESLAFKPIYENDPTLEGKAGRLNANLIGWDAGGGLNLHGRYNGLGLLICCAMGYENPNDAGATYHGSPETVSGKYKHIFELDDHLETHAWQTGERLASGAGGGTWDSGDKKVRRFLLGIAKGVSDHRFNSCMVNKMTIDITPQAWTFAFELLAYNRVRGSYNSANWTYATDRRSVIFPNTVFSLSGTEYGFDRFRIELNNNLAAPRTTEGGLYIPEPRRNGMRTVEIGWDDPIYTSDDRIDDMEAGTNRYGHIKGTSGDYALGFYFNKLLIDDAQAPVTSPAIIKMSHGAKAYLPGSDNYSAEWSNISLIQEKEMICMLVNDYASNYLTAE